MEDKKSTTDDKVVPKEMGQPFTFVWIITTRKQKKLRENEKLKKSKELRICFESSIDCLAVIKTSRAQILEALDLLDCKFMPPKPGRSAWDFFYENKKQELLRISQNAEKSSAAKFVSNIWKFSPPNEKKIFEDRAEKDGNRYSKQKKEYEEFGYYFEDGSRKAIKIPIGSVIPLKKRKLLHFNFKT